MAPEQVQRPHVLHECRMKFDMQLSPSDQQPLSGTVQMSEGHTMSCVLREPSTTPRVAANSSLNTPWSWKKSRQNRYSEVAVSMSSLLRLRKSTCACQDSSNHFKYQMIASNMVAPASEIQNWVAPTPEPVAKIITCLLPASV